MVSMLCTNEANTPHLAVEIARNVINTLKTLDQPDSRKDGSFIKISSLNHKWRFMVS